MRNRQYDFTREKSMDDVWMYLKRSVNESGEKYVIGVFVDFQGAFDNVGQLC